MKIVLHNASPFKTDAERIASLLAHHSPHHHYHPASPSDPHIEGDLWHFLSASPSLALLRHSDRSVITLENLHFINYPHIFSPLERYLLHPLMRLNCRRAARLVTHSAHHHRDIIEKLGIEPSRVSLTPSLITLHSRHLTGEDSKPSNDELIALRNKFELPQSFILSLGELDSRYGQADLVAAILESDIPVDVVICGRHSPYADEILSFARSMNCATRVHLLYETTLRERTSLYHLALGVVYTSPEDAPIEPIIEALRRGTAMILSSTNRNRECARNCAIYLDSLSRSAITTALRTLLYDQSTRGQMRALALAEAERYSEKQAAHDLASIYDEIS